MEQKDKVTGAKQEGVKGVAAQTPAQAPAAQQTVVEKAAVAVAPNPVPAPPAHQPAPEEKPRKCLRPEEVVELPFGYGDNRLVALVRDPYWIYVYWELTQKRLRQARYEFKAKGRTEDILRLHDVTGLDMGSNRFADFQAWLDARNYYMQVWEPDREYIAELGWRDEEGNFFMLLRSNRVRMPRTQPSNDYGQWKDFNAQWEELFRLSGGFLKPGEGGGPSGKPVQKLYLSNLNLGGSPSSPWGSSWGKK